MGGVAFGFSGQQIAGDDAPGFAVLHDQVNHFVAVKKLHIAETDLATERLVRSQEQLLARLTPSVECPADLHSAERPVG